MTLTLHTSAIVKSVADADYPSVLVFENGDTMPCANDLAAINWVMQYAWARHIDEFQLVFELPGPESDVTDYLRRAIEETAQRQADKYRNTSVLVTTRIV